MCDTRLIKPFLENRRIVLIEVFLWSSATANQVYLFECNGTVEWVVYERNPLSYTPIEEAR
jgi:hypothetical protein